jgi:hypothetical protein
MSVGRGRHARHFGGCGPATERWRFDGNLAGTLKGVPGGSSRDPSTSVERRLRPRTPASFRSRRLASRQNVAMNPTPPWPARGSPAQKAGRVREETRAERSEALSLSVSTERDDKSGSERTQEFVGWEAGAQRARRLRLGSNPEVEGPRRGTKPRKNRPETGWKRQVPVRTHRRSNASKVKPHGVRTRASKPATEATSRFGLCGKQTPRGQRSRRRDTAAGGGNSSGGMKRAAGKRSSRA